MENGKKDPQNNNINNNNKKKKKNPGNSRFLGTEQVSGYEVMV